MARLKPALTVANGWHLGQMQAVWTFPDNNQRKYIALSARWWEIHYTVNDQAKSGEVNKFHITFEEVDVNYAPVANGRNALHWEWSTASSSYECKGWKWATPMAMPLSTTVMVPTQVPVPATIDATMAELPMGLSYLSEADYVAATTQTINVPTIVPTVAAAFLNRIRSVYLRKPQLWFGTPIADPVWTVYN